MHAHHSPRTSVVWHEDWLAALSAKFFPWLIDRLVQRRLQQVVILLYTTICSTTRLRVSGEVQVLIGAIWKYPSRRQAYTKYEKRCIWITRTVGMWNEEESGFKRQSFFMGWGQIFPGDTLEPMPDYTRDLFILQLFDCALVILFSLLQDMLLIKVDS